jgi:hypothetical protein
MRSPKAAARSATQNRIHLNIDGERMISGDLAALAASSPMTGV